MAAQVDSTKPEKGPVRTCAVCRKPDSPDQLVRWVRDEAGHVFPDLSGRKFGRGAWTHPRPGCLHRIGQALSRSYRAPVVTTDAEAARLLSAAADHRVGQLLGTARRQGRLAVGTTPVLEAIEAGEALLVIVATDAEAAARLDAVRRLVREGRACAWGKKEALGRLCGRPEIAVLAVRDPRLARGLFGAIAMALLGPESNGANPLGGIPTPGEEGPTASKELDGG